MTLLFDDGKKLEKAIGPEAAGVVAAIFERQDAKIESQKETIKKELLAELATKADLATLRGELREDMARLEGSLREDLARLEGRIDARFARLEVMVKTLIGLTALAVAFFSPVAEKLLALIK